MPCEPNTCGSVGVFTSMLVEDSDVVDPCVVATFDDQSERYEILSENIRYTDTLLGGSGLTGTIDKVGVHTRHGARIVTGQVTMEVGPYELEKWLPRIMLKDGPSPFTMDETADLNPFDIMLKRDQGTVIYRHCAVRGAVFNAVASIGGNEQVMRMTLDILGYEEHDATYPATPPDLPSSPRLYWLLGDGKLTLDTPTVNTEYYFDSFSLRIDNGLTPLLRNFLRTTCIQSRGRDVTLRLRSPYTSGSHSNLYISDYSGECVLNFLGTKNDEVDNLYVTTFTFPEVHQIRRTPSTRGPGEIPLAVDFTAYRTSSAGPLTVTNSYS